MSVLDGSLALRQSRTDFSEGKLGSRSSHHRNKCPKTRGFYENTPLYPKVTLRNLPKFHLLNASRAWHQSTSTPSSNSAGRTFLYISLSLYFPFYFEYHFTMFWTLGCIYGATSVAFGAFGAHGLKKRIADPAKLANWSTAAEYQARPLCSKGSQHSLTL
jgi:hypothetical protein